MRNLAPLFAAAVVFGSLSMGCASYVPFTYELRSEHRLSDDEVKDLQFYSSHEITLRREAQSQDRQVTAGHKLRLISGKSIEEVVIPAKTPGVAMQVAPDRIAVSFVSGTTLEFVTSGSRSSLDSFGSLLLPQPENDGLFQARPRVSANFLGQYAEPPHSSSRPVKIVRDDPPPPPRPMPAPMLGGNYFLAVSSGQVSFAGVSWDAVEDTGKTYLLIDADKLEETEEKRTVLPGVRLGD